MNRIVVTGATGMIGSALIRSCLAHGIERVYAVVRPNCQKLHRIPTDSRIVLIECAINDYARLPKLIAQPCDVFYHAAWSLTGAMRNSDVAEQTRNVLYTLDALHAAKELGCSTFVGTGSQAEYGRLDMERIGPNAPVHPIQAYGIAKYTAGRMAMLEAEKLELSCFWVRVFSVYGIYDKPTSMISSTLKSMLQGERVRFTAGEQLWDYLYCDDAGDALRLIGEKSKGREVYCLGSGVSMPLRSYIETMRDAANPSLEIGIGELPYRADTPMQLCADIDSLCRDTGFEPRTTFGEGINQTIQWMKDTSNVEGATI